MTVFAKDITYGLETRVKEFQEYLNTKLANYWSGELEIFGLVKPKLKDDIIVPEAYKGTGIGEKEYTEVFINDKVTASVGFILQDRSTLPDRKANIDIAFTLRIDRIYPNSTTRDIEKALLEAEKIIEGFFAVDNVLDIKEGITDVFAGFDTERIKHRDMHPWYVFSLNVDLPYYDDSCL